MKSENEKNSKDDLSSVADISSKPKNIFRKKKHRDGEFIMMDKKIIENEKMSLEEKALLYYLLSKPPKWVVRITDIRRRCKIGKDKAHKLINELVRHGHIVKENLRESNGTFGSVRYLVFESSQIPSLENPETENPENDIQETENPKKENQDHSNNTDVVINNGNNKTTTTDDLDVDDCFEIPSCLIDSESEVRDLLEKIKEKDVVSILGQIESEVNKGVNRKGGKIEVPFFYFRKLCDLSMKGGYIALSKKEAVPHNNKDAKNRELLSKAKNLQFLMQSSSSSSDSLRAQLSSICAELIFT